MDTVPSGGSTPPDTDRDEGRERRRYHPDTDSAVERRALDGVQKRRHERPETDEDESHAAD